jgi:hypothetical protein
MEFDNPLFEAQANSVERLSQTGGLGERLVETSESEVVLIVETGQRDGALAVTLDPSAVAPRGIGGPTR